MIVCSGCIRIRPLDGHEIRERRRTGRRQISTAGRKLVDGVPFGRTFLGQARDRRALGIPARGKKRKVDNGTARGVRFEDEDDGDGDDDGEIVPQVEWTYGEGGERALLEDEDDEDDEDYEENSEDSESDHVNEEEEEEEEKDDWEEESEILIPGDRDEQRGANEPAKADRLASRVGKALRKGTKLRVKQPRIAGARVNTSKALVKVRDSDSGESSLSSESESESDSASTSSSNSSDSDSDSESNSDASDSNSDSDSSSSSSSHSSSSSSSASSPKQSKTKTQRISPKGSQQASKSSITSATPGVPNAGNKKTVARRARLKRAKARQQLVDAGVLLPTCSNADYSKWLEQNPEGAAAYLAKTGKGWVEPGGSKSQEVIESVALAAVPAEAATATPVALGVAPATRAAKVESSIEAKRAKRQEKKKRHQEREQGVIQPDTATDGTLPQLSAPGASPSQAVPPTVVAPSSATAAPAPPQSASYNEVIRPAIELGNQSDGRKQRFVEAISTVWGKDWMTALDPKGLLLPSSPSEHLLRVLRRLALAQPSPASIASVAKAIQEAMKERITNPKPGRRTVEVVTVTDLENVEKTAAASRVIDIDAEQQRLNTQWIRQYANNTSSKKRAVFNKMASIAPKKYTYDKHGNRVEVLVTSSSTFAIPEAYEEGSQQGQQTADSTTHLDAWRSKITLSAVECEQEGLELPEPTFPFVQPGMRIPSAQRAGQKRKRGKAKGKEKGYYDQYEYETGRLDNAEGAGALDDWDNYNYYEDEPVVGNQLKKIATSTSVAEAPEEVVEDDLPPLPADPTTLPPLTKNHVLPRTVIAFKQLTMDAYYNPIMADYRTGIVTEMEELQDGDMVLWLRLATRDMPKRKYDEETGEIILRKFEMPGEEGEDGVLEIMFREMIDPRIVKPVGRDRSSGEVATELTTISGKAAVSVVQNEEQATAGKEQEVARRTGVVEVQAQDGGEVLISSNVSVHQEKRELIIEHAAGTEATDLNDQAIQCLTLPDTHSTIVASAVELEGGMEKGIEATMTEQSGEMAEQDVVGEAVAAEQQLLGEVVEQQVSRRVVGVDPVEHVEGERQPQRDVLGGIELFLGLDKEGGEPREAMSAGLPLDARINISHDARGEETRKVQSPKVQSPTYTAWTDDEIENILDAHHPNMQAEGEEQIEKVNRAQSESAVEQLASPVHKEQPKGDAQIPETLPRPPPTLTRKDSWDELEDYEVLLSQFTSSQSLSVKQEAFKSQTTTPASSKPEEAILTHSQSKNLNPPIAEAKPTSNLTTELDPPPKKRSVGRKTIVPPSEKMDYYKNVLPASTAPAKFSSKGSSRASTGSRKSVSGVQAGRTSTVQPSRIESLNVIDLTESGDEGGSDEHGGLRVPWLVPSPSQPVGRVDAELIPVPSTQPMMKREKVASKSSSSSMSTAASQWRTVGGVKRKHGR